MLAKTSAIFLNHVRYSDNSLIAHFYTRDYGRLSVMVRGISSKKGTARFNYFQPLNILNIELYHQESREMHNLKEMSLAYVPKRISGDIHRTAIALFISEILYNVIREEELNKKLYEFLESSIITLDEMTSGISNFHLWFLAAFMAYAGIGPSCTTGKTFYFDMLSGQFTSQQPLHTDFLEPGDALILNSLLSMPAGEIYLLQLTGKERTDLLERLIKYYRLHLSGIREIRSLQILNEVFR